jgi:threonine/homoserine efflux transporter RhtA
MINMLTLQPLIALVAGILILLVPRILNYVVAIYLIVVGVVGLLPHIMR